MPAYVVDIEANNLIDDVTKIHCLSYTPVAELNVKSLVTYDEIRHFLSQDDLTIIGHKFIEYDAPVLEKILGIKVKAKFVDTLGISYYLNSSNGRQKHGLDSYGTEYGVPKPPVADWNNEPIEVYVHRCNEDVKINWHLWKDQQNYLRELYDNDSTEILRLIDYIGFKYDCLKEQNENRIPVDVDTLVEEMIYLEQLVDEKREQLLSVMPQVVKYKTVKKPTKMEKADGSLSVIGEKWNELVRQYNLDETDVEVQVEASRDTANPDSTSQIKDWLYTLGWIPRHIKFVRDKVTNNVKQIPQINDENDSTEICQSIVELSEEVPELKALAGYSTVKHRLTILKGFIRDMDKDCKLSAEAMGFTNTFRLKHRILVNLPKPSAPYAGKIRACLIAGEDNYMVGSDLKGIEDATKQHYIFPFDPDYVKSMQTEDWDAHLDIAVRAGLLTEQQVTDHKAGTANYKSERHEAKTVNFSATYKVGAKTLARSLKCTVKKAQTIIDAYWERNKALLQFEKTCKTKTVRGQLWVQQPVSRFWYTLRNLKDIFSTVNQSTAVYVFDMWMKYVRKEGIKMSYQAHDEWVSLINNSMPEKEVTKKVKNAMKLTNEELKLNVQIDCSLDYGNSYFDVH